ncbi:hypothetical protein ACFX12_034748 [Malus domestica]
MTFSKDSQSFPDLDFTVETAMILTLADIRIVVGIIAGGRASFSSRGKVLKDSAFILEHDFPSKRGPNASGLSSSKEDVCTIKIL